MKILQTMRNAVPFAENTLDFFSIASHQIKHERRVHHVLPHVAAGHIHASQNFCVERFVWNSCKRAQIFLLVEFKPHAVLRIFEFVLTVAQNFRAAFLCEQVAPSAAFGRPSSDFIRIRVANQKIIFVLVGINEPLVRDVFAHVRIPILVIRNDFRDERDFRF